MKFLKHIDFNNPPKDESWDIPYEVYEYYVKNDYRERNIPLNLDTAKEIFNILKAEHK